MSEIPEIERELLEAARRRYPRRRRIALPRPARGRGALAAVAISTLLVLAWVVTNDPDQDQERVAQPPGAVSVAQLSGTSHSTKANQPPKDAFSAAFSALAALPPDTSSEAQEIRERFERLHHGTFPEIRAARKTAAYTLYVSWNKTSVCTWVQTRQGGVFGRSRVQTALNPRTPMAAQFKDSQSKTWQVLALVPDSVTGGRVIGPKAPAGHVTASQNVLDTTLTSHQKLAITDSAGVVATISAAR